MTQIDWIVILLYLAGLPLVGAIFARSNKSSSDMFMAGRSSPWWLSGLSAYMTMFSAGTFVVWGGITYEFGMVGPMICAVYGVAAFIAGRFFAARWHDTRLSTAAEFIHLRFGRGAFSFYTVYRGVYLCMAGLTLYALAVMLCPLMPLPDGHWLQDPATGNLSIDWACVILTVIVIGYTMSGGLWAVLMTDALQFIVLTLCVIVIVPLIIRHVGGFEAIISASPEGFFLPTAPGFTWVFLLGWMLTNCFALGAEWQFVQRHLCVPSARDARKAMYLFGWLYLFTPFLWMAPPFIYRMIDPSADPQEAYILAAAMVLPAGMIGMMIAAMFSATASMVSSLLNVFAGVLTDDVYRRFWRPHATEAQAVRAGRVFTVLIGGYILAGALILPRLGTYRDILIMLGSLVGPSILLPTIWALFSHRISRHAVWTTLAGGISAAVLLRFGFGPSGWFVDWPVLSGISDVVRSYPRESDVMVGILVPLTLLVAAEIAGRDYRPEWQRLREAIDKTVVADASPTQGASLLPLKIMASAFGGLGALMFTLALWSGAQWPVMAVAGSLLLMLCGVMMLALRRIRLRGALHQSIGKH